MAPKRDEAPRLPSRAAARTASHRSIGAADVCAAFFALSSSDGECPTNVVEIDRPHSLRRSLGCSVAARHRRADYGRVLLPHFFVWSYVSASEAGLVFCSKILRKFWTCRALGRYFAEARQRRTRRPTTATGALRTDDIPCANLRF